MNQRKTISINQACQLVDVSRRTIYNWIQTGKVEFVRTAGGSIRIFPGSLFRPATPPVRSATPLPPFPQGPLIHPSDRASLGMENPKMPMAKAHL
jgi:excisionase family DNA binding protein